MSYENMECKYCDGFSRGDTCYKAVACPTCKAGVGKSCLRPSAHRAAQIHADRVALAQYIDDQNGFDWKAAYADLIKEGVKA